MRFRVTFVKLKRIQLKNFMIVIKGFIYCRISIPFIIEFGYGDCAKRQKGASIITIGPHTSPTAIALKVQLVAAKRYCWLNPEAIDSIGTPLLGYIFKCLAGILLLLGRSIHRMDVNNFELPIFLSKKQISFVPCRITNEIRMKI